MSIFEEIAMNIGEEIMAIDDFYKCSVVGILTPDDGSGWYGTETHYTYTHNVWRHLPPEGATHVHWYNK